MTTSVNNNLEKNVTTQELFDQLLQPFEDAAHSGINRLESGINSTFGSSVKPYAKSCADASHKSVETSKKSSTTVSASVYDYFISFLPGKKA